MTAAEVVADGALEASVLLTCLVIKVHFAPEPTHHHPQAFRLAVK